MCVKLIAEVQSDVQFAILSLRSMKEKEEGKKNFNTRILIVSTVPLVKLKAGSTAQLFYLPDSEFVKSTLRPEYCSKCLFIYQGLDYTHTSQPNIFGYSQRMCQQFSCPFFSVCEVQPNY